MDLVKTLLCLAALLGMSCANRMDPASLRLAGRQDLDISRDETAGTPTLVKGILADIAKVKKQKRAEALLQFIRENSQLFKLDAPDQELRLLRSDGDELGFTHYRFERVHKGVPIYGDELMLHVNAKSQIYQVNGQYHPSMTSAAEPAITAQKADSIALEQGMAHRMQKVDRSVLVFYPVEQELRLAWHVTLSGGMNKWDYFIDAQNGAVLYDQDLRRF